MGRKGTTHIPGIHLDQAGVYWATLEGEDAKLWRQRYPGRTVPRRKAKDLNEARKLQRQLIEDLKAGRDLNAGNPKVSEWVKTCIDRKRDLAPSTLRCYRQLLKWQIEPHRVGRMKVLQVARKQVEEWVNTLTTQKSSRLNDGERILDPYTVRNAFALLKMAFNLALEDGLITKNPCSGVKLPRPDDEEIRPLTESQIQKLFETIKGHRNAALYYVAIRCGLRQGELLGLRWSDVDLERGTISITSQLQWGNRTRTKTKKSRRTVPIPADVVEIVRWHLTNQTQERGGSEDWNRDGLVFCSENGTSISARNLDRQFKAFLSRAGLPEIRFHDLRHTYATRSLADGMNLHTLSRRMGHSSITVTADRYGHLEPITS